MKLKDICEINPRTQGIADYTSVSFVPMPCVSEDGKIDPSEIRQFIDVKKGYTVFQENDVLFAKITPCMENGKGAIARGLMNGIGCGSSEFHVLRANNKLVCPEWIYYLTAWSSFRREAEKYMTGSAGQRRVPKAYLENYDINVPSLPEQTKQTEVLAQLQQIIDCRKKELQKLDELIKARFVEMFGDPVLNEKGWKTKPLLDMGNCKNGMNFHYDDCGVEINCLGVGDFKDLSVIENTEQLPKVSLNEMPSEDYLLKNDDIVFVRSNGNKALVGRSLAVYPGDVPTTFSGFCIRYRKHDDSITVPYLLRVLKTDSIRTKMAGRGANIQNLNQQMLGTLIIPVPPIELQLQFADFVKQVDKSKVIETNAFRCLKYNLMPGFMAA